MRGPALQFQGTSPVAKAKVAVFISGSGTNMAALLYASRAADCPYEIALVLSNDPAARGLALARAEGVATFALPHKGIPRAQHDALMEEQVLAAGAHVIALAGYMRILSGEFVARWEGRMVNIHPSLLPAFPGLHTHRRALQAGCQVAGATVHFVTPELDHGPIVLQAAVPVRPGDDEHTLAARVLASEHIIYPLAVRWFVEGALELGDDGRVRHRGGASQVLM
jgi:phosphoribosylglycinamide formyltransferase-1/phosphoribosylamine--glycine ligase/phosphoribosylglycinamide formyltransferase/phosphoribosylformylglycinamidine cyclo-ligase